MNTHSFEYDLQHLAAPPPDPSARERARSAALEEFERNRGRLQQQPVRRWNPRNARWSGLAAACVAVVGVAMYWMLPPGERAVQTERAMNLDVVQEASPPVSATSAATEPAAPSRTPPKEEASAKASVSQIVPPTRLDMPLPPNLTSAPVREPRATAKVQPQESRKAEAPTTALTRVTNQPAPPAPVPPPAPSAAAASSGTLAEVAVTGSRLVTRDMAFNSPMPIVGVEEENRDKFEHFDTNPVKLTNEEPVSTFSIDVDTASYSFVRRQLNEGLLPPADAVRVEEMINYFDYAWPAPTSRARPFQPTVAVSDSPWGQGRKLVHIGIKGYELPARQQPDVNLVLLLDVSGSMNSPDKLPLAQRSMALLLDSLKPTDTVAIVVYAGAAGQVLAPTPVRDKQTILQALNSLRPGGSTAGAAGIQLAYELAERNFRKEGVNRILLATDGDFNVGITDREALKNFVEREREKGVYLSVLGFGEGNYRDEMAQTLAQNGNGVAAYIDTLNEARKVLVQQAGAALFTIAKDVKLQVEFNPQTVAEYRLVGYETRALNREDFNNDKVDAGDIGAGHTVTAIYEITPVESSTRMIEPRRYPVPDTSSARLRGRSGEYGFLKIRYKLPDGNRSQLVETPIRATDRVPSALRQDVEFSTAVAGFAQLLRGGRYTGSLRYEDVLRQAQAARGEDPYGYRAEFVQLVRLAQQAR
jgi:Ca-activated chloride channel family protein